MLKRTAKLRVPLWGWEIVPRERGAGVDPVSRSQRRRTYRSTVWVRRPQPPAPRPVQIVPSAIRRT